MKAEHRKELETNALADRMGRLLGNLKEKPQRGTVFWVIGAVLAVVVVFMSLRWYRVGKDENSEGWYSYYVYDIKTLNDSYQEKPQGQAIRFEAAWERLWSSMRKIGVDPRGAKDGIGKAKQEYEELAKEVESDPILAPEALYALAVIEETLALENRRNLDNALERYEEVVTKHKESAYGKLAAARVEALKNETTRKEITDLYQDLSTVVGFDRMNQLDRLLDPHKNILDPNKKK